MSKVQLILFLCCSLVVYSRESIDYGFDVPNTSLNIGGYIDAVYNKQDEEPFMFDDLALLISASEGRLDFLSEVEISHLRVDGKSDNGSEIHPNIERLQLSYALDDNKIVTLGRFNSNIGYWNQTPVNILQDTISYPHFIKTLFPKATTGLMYQNCANSGNYSLMIQYSNDLGQKDTSIVVDRHFAGSYYKVYDDFSWRVGGGYYREYNLEEARYFGIGADYETEDISFQSELFIHKSTADKSKPYSGYVQAVWHVTDTQNLVTRLERYRDDVLSFNEAIMLLGYTYRPWSNVAFKVEYLYHTQEPLSGFVYSASVMF